MAERAVRRTMSGRNITRSFGDHGEHFSSLGSSAGSPANASPADAAHAAPAAREPSRAADEVGPFLPPAMGLLRVEKLPLGTTTCDEDSMQTATHDGVGGRGRRRLGNGGLLSLFLRPAAVLLRSAYFVGNVISAGLSTIRQCIGLLIRFPKNLVLFFVIFCSLYCVSAVFSLLSFVAIHRILLPSATVARFPVHFVPSSSTFHATPYPSISTFLPHPADELIMPPYKASLPPAPPLHSFAPFTPVASFARFTTSTLFLLLRTLGRALQVIFLPFRRTTPRAAATRPAAAGGPAAASSLQRPPADLPPESLACPSLPPLSPLFDSDALCAHPPLPAPTPLGGKRRLEGRDAGENATFSGAAFDSGGEEPATARRAASARAQGGAGSGELPAAGAAAELPPRTADHCAGTDCGGWPQRRQPPRQPGEQFSLPFSGDYFSPSLALGAAASPHTAGHGAAHAVVELSSDWVQSGGCWAPRALQDPHSLEATKRRAAFRTAYRMKAHFREGRRKETRPLAHMQGEDVDLSLELWHPLMPRRQFAAVEQAGYLPVVVTADLFREDCVRSNNAARRYNARLATALRYAVAAAAAHLPVPRALLPRPVRADWLQKLPLFAAVPLARGNLPAALQLSIFPDVPVLRAEVVARVRLQGVRALLQAHPFVVGLVFICSASAVSATVLTVVAFVHFFAPKGGESAGEGAGGSGSSSGARMATASAGGPGGVDFSFSETTYLRDREDARLRRGSAGGVAVASGVGFASRSSTPERLRVF